MSMRRFVAALLLSLLTAFAAETATCEKPFETNFRSGGVLKMDLRPGDIDIVGTDTTTIRVTCDMTRGSDDPRDIAIRFDASGPNATLKVRGGGHNDGLRLRIEVPRQTHVSVRCMAGDVEVSGVRGDKDVALRAGDLKIFLGDPADYAEVYASVNVGDLDLAAFGVHKSGFLRRYRKSQKEGSYNLRATLWAGDIKLK